MEYVNYQSPRSAKDTVREEKTNYNVVIWAGTRWAYPTRVVIFIHLTRYPKFKFSHNTKINSKNFGGVLSPTLPHPTVNMPPVYNVYYTKIIILIMTIVMKIEYYLSRTRYYMARHEGRGFCNDEVNLARTRFVRRKYVPSVL